MKFELPKELPSIIKVIGVGGGGSNAVNHMFRQGIKGVEFLVCNTDLQALQTSPVPHKIQLGASLTEGRGAGSMPEVGRHSAIENIEDLRQALSDHTKMVFITAGMGGGTGTGAAPIIANLAREMDILTVAIVTIPFAFEGKKRKVQAEAGIEELKKCVDTLLIICNDKLREIYGNLKLAEAFGQADNVLATAARSIAEIISVTLHVNVDFADVDTVMKKSGVAIMGSAVSSGENRAVKAVEQALDSPLLNDSDIAGARYILLNITSGDQEITMDEMGDITDFIQQQAGQTAEVIMGVGTDEALGDQICVTIIATGFKTKDQIREEKPVQRIIYNLDEYQKKETIAEVFRPEKNPLEPELISEDDAGTGESPVAAFIDEEKIYEPDNDPVIYQLDDDTLPDNAGQPEGGLFAHPAPAEAPATDEGSSLTEEPAAAEDIEVRENVFTFEVGSQPETADESETPVSETPADDTVNAQSGDTPEAEAGETPEAAAAAPAEPPVAGKEETAGESDDPHEELFRRARERIMKLKEMSYRLTTPQGINDLEKEPAFRRKNIKLDDTPPSGNPNISKFSLIEDKDKNVEIKPNSFLHDRVD